MILHIIIPGSPHCLAMIRQCGWVELKMISNEEDDELRKVGTPIYQLLVGQSSEYAIVKKHLARHNPDEHVLT